MKFNPKALIIAAKHTIQRVGHFLNPRIKWAISITREEGFKRFLFVIIRVLHLKLIRFLYLRIGKNYKLETIQGSKLYLDLNDKGISTELFIERIREVESTKNLQRILRKGDIVIDIGANIGYYALMEARLVAETGKVYACEPIPKSIELLKKSIEANHYANIEILNIALGDRNGTAEIYLSRNSNWHSMSDLRTFEEMGKMVVEVRTVDKLLEDTDFPNFIRMDVEGYESKVIKGMENTMKNSKLTGLFIEIHPVLLSESELVELLTTLKRNSFEIAKMTIGTRPERTYDSITIDDILQNGMPQPHHVGAETFFERKSHL